MENVLHWVAGAFVAGLLVVAWPQIVHQATSDEGDGWSGACPDCPSHWEIYDLGFTIYEAENSLPPSY